MNTPSSRTQPAMQSATRCRSGVLAALTFWWIYRGHAKAVTHALGVQIVTRRDEPRFVQIAEEQCTALGVRLPRFGIIEAREPNAVTVGEGPARGLIAVTRGLLDRLDDDELAAILAHEASHIRQGDTRLLAANHALMRTAVIMYMNNPLRMEDWRQMVIGVLMPPMLLLMLMGGAVTSFCIELSRAARRGLKTRSRPRRRRRGHPRHAFSRGPGQRDREGRRPRRLCRQPSCRRHAVRRARRPRGRKSSGDPGPARWPSGDSAATL